MYETDTAIREMLEKVLNVYDMPEIGIKIALAYIDGLKMGSAMPLTPPEAQNDTATVLNGVDEMELNN